MPTIKRSNKNRSPPYQFYEAGDICTTQPNGPELMKKTPTLGL